MSIFLLGYGFSNAPWTTGGSPVWAVLLYGGFLFYVGACFKAGQTELYVLTVTKDEKPTLYWSMMGILTIAALTLGYCLFKNLL